MLADRDTLYRAIVSHDARFDGAFFVAVRTTKIYCRTICRVKVPLSKNCSFFRTAAEAERAGYRPCLRCRPELAPGNSSMDAVSRLAHLAMARVDEGALTHASVADLADEFGVSDRHLRRVMQTELGVSPIELAQTHRLHLAKRLLTDTNLSVTDVAFASGFKSLRRFNALFKSRYRLQPQQFRKTKTEKPEGDFIRAELGFRPPMDWAEMLQFFSQRAVAGVEKIENQIYYRTVGIGKHHGIVRVTCLTGKNILRAEVSASLLPVLIQTLARLKNLFDLTANSRDRIPGAFDTFEIAVRAILGQQITVKAATTLVGRFTARFGAPIQTEISDLTHLTATAARVAKATLGEIAELGIIAGRADAIRALAICLTQNKISLEPKLDVEDQIASLQEIKGIGEWTANYIAMRCLAWPRAYEFWRNL